MIKYEHANIRLNIIISILNSSDSLDNLIFNTLREMDPRNTTSIDYQAAERLFKTLEKDTHIEFNKHFTAAIIAKYMIRNKDYMNSMEHYHDIHILDEACRYKIKFIKLSQKTSQIKNRRKTK